MATFKQIDYKPKDRQFVAMWEYNGKIWADTVCWIDEEKDFLVWSDVDEMYLEPLTLSEYAESCCNPFSLSISPIAKGRHGVMLSQPHTPALCLLSCL